MSRKKKYYSCSAIQEFIQKMLEQGFEFIQLSEGTLQLGRFVLLSPDDRHWNFLFNEEYINAWSSGMTMRKFRKISKALQKEIDAVCIS